MVEGKIFSGEGDAAYFLSLDPYRKFIEEKTGIDPYPGTLNVRVDPEEGEKLKEKSRSFHMAPTMYDGKKLGGLKVFEAYINGKKCCVVEPELTRHGKDVLEVVSSFNIREEFNLKDGDSLEVFPVI